MTGTEIVQSTAYGRAGLEERQRYVRSLARAGDLLPASLQTMAMVGDRMQKVGDPGKVMLMAETGDMLGIHPMAALTGVHIIEGKPSISANLMGGLVRKAGHRLRVRTEGSMKDGTLRATATLTRSNDPDFEFEVTWDVEKATRAGLLPGKPNSNWQKYPEAMMKARAISEIIREGAPDVLMGGNVYTPEELGAQVTETGDPIEFEVVREQQPPRQERTAAPIVEEQVTEATDDFDYVAAAAAAASRQEVLELFQRAKMNGDLNTVIEYDGNSVELGAFIIDIGKAMAAAEAELDVPGEALADEGEPAVLDPEIIEGEVIEDGSGS